MSNPNKDVKTVDSTIGQVFEEIDKHLEWDQLFNDHAMASTRNKGYFSTEHYSPLIALAEAIQNISDELSQQFHKQIESCLISGLKQRLTKDELDSLFDVLLTDITLTKESIYRDNRFINKRLVMEIKSLPKVITWDNIYTQYRMVISDPEFFDRVLEILRRYNKNKGAQIGGIIEDCVKKNFLQKLPNDISEELKQAFAEDIEALNYAYNELLERTNAK